MVSQLGHDKSEKQAKRSREMAPQRHLIDRGPPNVPRRCNHRTPVCLHPLAPRPSVPPCRSTNVRSACAHPSMPYRCRCCRKRFSVRTESVMANTKLGYRTWCAGHLPAVDLHQGHLQHEAQPRAGHNAEVGLAPPAVACARASRACWACSRARWSSTRSTSGARSSCYDLQRITGAP